MIRLKYLIQPYKKSNIQAGEGQSDGPIPFYTSSEGLKLYYNYAQYPSDSISMGTGGFASINYSSVPFSTSTDCFNFNGNKKSYTKFLYYWIYSRIDYVDDLYFWGTGLKHLQKPYFLNEKLALPTLDKQKQIADFLDEKVNKINKLIDLYRNKIAEFNIYKLQLISETICFGFHKNIDYKINKNIWIPKIPCHWNIKRAKYVFNSLTKGSGITKEQVYENGDTQCIRYGEIYTKYNYSFSSTFSKTYEKEIRPQKIAHYGDILFAGTGELISEIGKNVVYLGDKKLLVGGDIIIGKHHHNPIFLDLALICPLSQEQKSRGKSKLKVVHISASEIGNILLPVPPLEEQNCIAEYLNVKIKTIEKIINNYDKKINTLGDYKKSLIYEYVSGKKEVSL